MSELQQEGIFNLGIDSGNHDTTDGAVEDARNPGRTASGIVSNLSSLAHFAWGFVDFLPKDFDCWTERIPKLALSKSSEIQADPAN